jgi:hypothetical protein
MLRSARSLTSSTRRQVMLFRSKPSRLPWNKWLSIMAASRLCAAVTACSPRSGAGSAPPSAPPGCTPPASGPALDPERGTHRRLPDGDSGPPAAVLESLTQAHRGGGLALPQWRRGNGRDHDVLRRRPTREFLNRCQLNLHDLVPVGLQQMRRDPPLGRDIFQRLERGASCYARSLGRAMTGLLVECDALTAALWLTVNSQDQPDGVQAPSSRAASAVMARAGEGTARGLVSCVPAHAPSSGARGGRRNGAQAASGRPGRNRLAPSPNFRPVCSHHE